MKRCPECRRDYFDDSLLYCLDDGSALLDGPGSARFSDAPTQIVSEDIRPDESSTLILSGEKAPAGPSVVVPKGSAFSFKRYGILLFVAIAVALAGAGYAVFSRLRVTAPAHAVSSVMVLPLKNIGPNAGDEYLSDGITDELTSKLASLKTVRVAAPSSAMRYKNSSKDAAEIGREMNVEAVIEGSVRRQGEKFRVSLHLINAVDGFELWSDSSFDGDVSDLLAAQSRLAELMAARLKGQLTPQEKILISGDATRNADAYELFLKGKQQFRNGQGQMARGLFDRAIELDPNFADAYAWRGRVVYGMFKGGRGDRSTLDAALSDADRALQINPDLISARVTLISIYHSTGQYEEGLKQGKLALRSDPDDLDAMEGAGLAYFRAGMINRAVPLYERALKVDPVSADLRDRLARTYLFAGEYQKGIDVTEPLRKNGDPVWWQDMLNYQCLGQVDKAIEVGRAGTANLPNDASLTLDYGRVLRSAGKPDEARAVWKKAAEVQESKAAAFDNVRTRIWLGTLYAELGERKKAIDEIERASEMEPDDAWTLFQIGCIYSKLDDRDRALDHLKASVDRGWLGIHYMGVDPGGKDFDDLANVRSDPEFQRLFIGLQKKLEDLELIY
jgi:TolB-like protein/Tfp pilus assembly protein PilF